MAAAIIKERYYILTPLSFLLGVLVLITTLFLAAASYGKRLGEGNLQRHKG